MRTGIETHREEETASRSLDIVVIGLSITSSWGNGHATTYRALVRGLDSRGHRVLFLERDVPWYAAARDLPRPPFGRTELYASTQELKDRFAAEIAGADLVIVGSYVPDAVSIGEWVTQTAGGATAFYDIDTPVTIADLARRSCEYLTRELIPRYDLYLSFTGGPVLRKLEDHYGARRALPLYCGVDTGIYFPEAREVEYDLAYMGTYSGDRQPVLERLLLEPARRWPGGRFAVVGPQYPGSIGWPANVERMEHLPPVRHRDFYNAQRFTLNITRRDMVRMGYAPSVRLFEAAACGTPIISDYWLGLETFFTLGEEVLIARTAEDALRHLEEIPEERRREIGENARRRVLSGHTSVHRAEELESYTTVALETRAARA